MNNMELNNPFFAMEQNKVDTYNQSQAEDDGTGLQCADCNNRGNIAFLSDGGTFTIRDCKCAGTRLTVRRLQKQGLYEAARVKDIAQLPNEYRHTEGSKKPCAAVHC